MTPQKGLHLLSRIIVKSTISWELLATIVLYISETNLNRLTIAMSLKNDVHETLQHR